MNVGNVTIDVKLNTSEAQQGIKKLENATVKSTRTINKQYDKSGKLIKTQISDSWKNAGVKYTQTTTKMVGSNSKLMTSLGSLAKKFSIAYIIIQATKALANFAKESLQAAEKVQKANNMVNTVFSGDNKGTVLEKAQSAITDSSLTQTQYKHYASLYGSMAENLGFGEDVSTMMATNLTDLQGNIAMFYDLTADEAYTKAKAVFTGETESIKELGIRFTDRALTEYSEAIYGKSYSDMSEMERATTRYEYFMEQMSQYSTSFKDMSNTWAGQVKIFESLSSSIKDNFGQVLSSVLYPALVAINRALEKLNNWLSSIATKFQNLSGQNLNVKSGITSEDTEEDEDEDSTTTSSSSSKQPSLLSFDKLNRLNSNETTASNVSAIKVSTDSINDGIKGLKKAAYMTADEQEALRDTLQTAKEKGLGLQLDVGAQEVKDLFKGYVETQFVVPAKGVKDVFDAVYTTGTQFADRIKEGLSKIDDSPLRTLLSLPAIISDALGRGIFQDLPENLKNNFNDTIDEMIESLSMNTSPIIKKAEEIITWINYGVAQALNGIKLIFGTAVEAISDIIKAIMDGPGGYSLNDAWDDISAYASNALADFQAQHEKTLEQLEAIQTNYDNALAEEKQAIAEQELKIFSETAQEFIEVDGLNAEQAIEVARTAAGVVDEVTDSMILKNQEYLKNLSSTNTYLLNYIDSIKNKFVSTVQEVASTLTSNVRTVAASVSATANGAKVIGSTSITGTTSTIASKYNQGIRKYATGGYVRANSPQLAIVGDNTKEGEIIAPESKIAEAVAAGMQPVLAALTQIASNSGTSTYSGPSSFQIKIGEREFNDAVVSAINSRSLRTGGI